MTIFFHTVIIYVFVKKCSFSSTPLNACNTTFLHFLSVTRNFYWYNNTTIINSQLWLSAQQPHDQKLSNTLEASRSSITQECQVLVTKNSQISVLFILKVSLFLQLLWLLPGQLSTVPFSVNPLKIFDTKGAPKIPGTKGSCPNFCSFASFSIGLLALFINNFNLNLNQNWILEWLDSFNIIHFFIWY